MDKRTWLPIPSFEGHYDVSDVGDVRSHKSGAPRELRPALNPRGYLIAYLHLDGIVHRRTVHSLVASAFIGPRPDGYEIRHLDGDRCNNRATNLAYGTGSENTYDAIAHGRHPNARKTECPQGHAYDAVTTTGRRRCMTCSREQLRASRARQKARLAD